MNDVQRAIVAFELDKLQGAAGVYREIRANGEALEEVIRCCGLYRDIDPVISLRSTADDIEWFRVHSDRTHRIRQAFDGEAVLRGRLATSHTVVIKQAQPGARVLCAIAETELTTATSDIAQVVRRVDRDGPLALLFDYATRFPGTAWNLDKIITQADEMESRAPSKRILS